MKTCFDEPPDTRDTAFSFRTRGNCDVPLPAMDEGRPDARELRIHEIRQRICAGTYVVDARKIAERMLDCRHFR